jgi:protein-disulfide isomerase
VLWRLAIITALAIGAETWLMERSASAPPIPAEKLATVPVAELLNDRNSRGPPDAPVKVVIFSDLWCSVCRAVHQPLLDYQTAHRNDVEVIFRHRPLSGIRGHETSETAAQLSEIAADGGEFWQFVEKLYREPHQLDHDGYLRLMRDLGFQSSRVEAILADTHARSIARVRRDTALAERLGVHSTPTFVLIIGHNPPVSANHRSLATILNSPAVQALFAHGGEPDEAPR